MRLLDLLREGAFFMAEQPVSNVTKKSAACSRLRESYTRAYVLVVIFLKQIHPTRATMAYSNQIQPNHS